MKNSVSQNLPIDRKKVTRGIGLCIYCHRSDATLTDEHVIPFSMMGTLVIEEASCLECARVTSLIERKIVRDLYEQPRHAARFPTRRPKRRKRNISYVDANRKKKITIDANEYPAYFPFLILGPPGIIDGRIATDPTKLGFWAPQIGTQNKDINVLFPEIKVDDYIKYIAKICHAAAYALLGNYCEKYRGKYLWKIMNGLVEHPLHIIGGKENHWPLLTAATSTRVTNSFSFTKIYHDFCEYLFVNIQFFSDIDGPAYMALFGRRKIGLLPMEQLPLIDLPITPPPPPAACQSSAHPYQ